jgi:hypothetical protein
MADIAERGSVVLESRAVRLEHRYKVLSSGEDVDVGLVGVSVLREALVRLPGYGRKGQAPPETERSIPCTGVITETEFRPEPRATRARGDGYRYRARTSYWIGAKLLADAADRATTLGY